MQYAVNDAIVHPTHGVGRITGIEHQELVEGFENYFVIDVPHKDMVLRVPMRSVDALGIRPAMSRRKLADVLGKLQLPPQELPGDFKLRQAQVRKLLASGRPGEIAEALRDLVWHERRAHLTKTDSDMLARARTLLTAEVAIVQGTDLAAAQELIERALNAGVPAGRGGEG